MDNRVRLIVVHIAETYTRNERISIDLDDYRSDEEILVPVVVNENVYRNKRSLLSVTHSGWS